MEEMKTAIKEYVKNLEEFVRGNEQRGYSLIIWDGKRIGQAETGRPRRIVRVMAMAIGVVIGNMMKDEKVGIDNLRKLTLQTYDEILDAALSTLEKRLGEEKMDMVLKNSFWRQCFRVCVILIALCSSAFAQASADFDVGLVNSQFLRKLLLPDPLQLRNRTALKP